MKSHEIPCFFELDPKATMNKPGNSLAHGLLPVFPTVFTVRVMAVMGPCRLGTPRPNSPESYSYSSKLSPGGASIFMN